MSSSMPRMTLPRKRDWKRGTPQVGLFLRDADGSVVQLTADRATPEERLAALVLLRIHQLPEETRERILAAARSFFDLPKEGETVPELPEGAARVR